MPKATLWHISAQDTVHCLCLYKIPISMSRSLTHLVVTFEPQGSSLFHVLVQSRYLTLGGSVYYRL